MRNRRVWMLLAAAGGVILLIVVAVVLIAPLVRPSERGGVPRQVPAERARASRQSDTSTDASHITAIIESYVHRVKEAHGGEHTQIQRDRLLAEAARELEAAVNDLGRVTLSASVQEVERAPQVDGGRDHSDQWRITIGAPQGLESVLSKGIASWSCGVWIRAPASEAQSIAKGDPVVLEGTFAFLRGVSLMPHRVRYCARIRVSPRISADMFSERNPQTLLLLREGVMLTLGSRQYEVVDY